MNTLFVVLIVSLFVGYGIGFVSGKESYKNNICWLLGKQNKHYLNDRITDEEDKLMNLLRKDDTSRAEFELAMNSLTYLKRKKRIFDWFLNYINNQEQSQALRITDEMIPFDEPDEGKNKHSKFKKLLLNPKIFEYYTRIFAPEETCPDDNTTSKTKESTTSQKRHEKLSRENGFHLKYITAVRDIAVAELSIRKAVFERMKVLAQLEYDDENEYDTIESHKETWADWAESDKEIDNLMKEVEYWLNKAEDESEKN